MPTRPPPAAPARPLPLQRDAPLLLPQPAAPPLEAPSTCVEAAVFDTTRAAASEDPQPPRFSLSAAACASAQALIAGQLNAAAGAQLAAPFAAAGCSGTLVRVCGDLAAPGGEDVSADVSALQEYVYTQLDAWLDAVLPEGDCREGTAASPAVASLTGASEPPSSTPLVVDV
ncbi:hypothetical protein HYH03_008298 [Edaphochlamys debaryana]|uniref:Uncharacterized protein n=1 Tax=Edaphochlamys debaryana TaxID=47281 RepID=A0A836BZ13_9CHLO|nr:hypothetical protein HYH03_008298 [Edaphochlamys debaryana]|eukprot:KAG2493482.1 hypothetical protein HYH03_008298 [Edaphochlamys debaryana]